MRMRTRRGRNGLITELSPAQYDVLREHLKSGYSFWSSHGRLGISMNVLQRLNQTDDKLLSIRHKFDQGRRCL